MKPTWRTVPISDLYDGLYDGPHATPAPAVEGPVFLGIKNVTDDGHLDLSDIRHIAEDDFGVWTRRVEPRAGDLVFTYEATLNRYAIIPKGFRGCLGRRMALIRPNPDRVDTRYLHFYFFTSAWRDVVRKHTLSGATVDRLPLSRFPEFPVRVPPLPIQRRIAGILAAYDDLVENCERRIRLLEEMARALYREWFVLFRYPGHENVPLVDSPLGRIPQGWKHVPVGEAFEVVGGGTPARREPAYWRDATIQWFSPSDLTAAGTMFMDKSSEQISERGLAESSARVFPPMSVMMTSRATIGAIAINTIPACTNQGFITCIPNERVPMLLLFNWLRTNVPLFERMASGATFKEISRGVFRTIDTLVPPRDLAQRFEALARPLAVLSLSLQRERASLRKTRDLLLPRLLSGDLPVEALE